MEENQSVSVDTESSTSTLTYLPPVQVPYNLKLGFNSECDGLVNRESITLDEARWPELSYVMGSNGPQSLSNFISISSAPQQTQLQETSGANEYKDLAIKVDPNVAASNALELTSSQAVSPERTRTSRRRAQNRAAQKAFRERKEQYLRNLESKVMKLEAAHQKLAAENEQLAQEIRNILTLIPADLIAFSCGHNDGRPTSTYTSRGCQTEPTSDDGDCFYSAGAAWDFIINHSLYDGSYADIDDLIAKLKYRAHSYVCGPLFTKSAIMDTLREYVSQKSRRLTF